MERLSATLMALCLAMVIVQSTGKSVQLDSFNLDCTPAPKFIGKDDQSTCFGRCKESECLAAIYSSAGPPTRSTCAIILKGAKCLPGPRGPFNVKLNVPSVNYNYRTSHTLDGSKEKKLYSTSGLGLDECKNFCSIVKGCNAVRSSPMTCQLLQLSGKQKAMKSGNGKGPLCHNNEWVYYSDKSMAPTEKGCEVMTN
ncbi:uncharacterized protein LOC129600987 [Paramacrobiotus metropolitanus]|uniref:uncharacterized protein LOC129600987 n=1 Tax=Paramacrobiotus metropolitanus TaxID=2943436 RepID=UPI00244640D6|nr:uncharacterized protein LOC129600987 [Paramacrobiotus metropolitanus]